MATGDHSKAVADYLRANTSLTVQVIGGPFYGQCDDDAIAVMMTGGVPGYKYNGGSETTDQPTVQVMVRGATNTKPQDVRANAAIVADAMRDADVTGYQSTWVDTDVAYAGTDSSGRPMYSVNLRLLIDQTGSE